MITDELGASPGSAFSVAQNAMKNILTPTAPGSSSGEAMRAQASGQAVATASATASPDARAQIVASQAAQTATQAANAPASSGMSGGTIAALCGGAFALIGGVYLGFFRGKPARLSGFEMPRRRRRRRR